MPLNKNNFPNVETMRNIHVPEQVMPTPGREVKRTGAYAYVGSFQYEGTSGIHICTFHEESGTLEYIRTAAPYINPGNVCVYKDWLFATDERMFGNVHTFRIDPASGDLEEIAIIDTLAVNPSYVTIDETECYAIITHFSVGGIVRRIQKTPDGKFQGIMLGNDSATCLYRLNEDGRIGELLDVGTHNPFPSPMTMIHKAYQAPGRNLFAENDLGGNKVYLFRIEEDKLNYLSEVFVGEGQEGPRHGAFHPTKPYLYINFEHKSTVAKIDVSNPEKPVLCEEVQLFTENETLEEEDNQAELMFRADGKILYSFMRGKGIVYVISVDEEDGHMNVVQRFRLPGNDPRGAFFTPDEKHIVVEGHYSDMVYTLDVDEDGTLNFADKVCQMERPACIGFFVPEH